MKASKPALQDLLKPGLRILFVGINPGLRSAKVGHHFAGHSNRFWKLLYDSGIIPIPLNYSEDWRLPEYGLGITNIINRKSAGISTLTAREYKIGLKALERKVRRHRPRVVALVGITIFRVLIEKSGAKTRPVDLGFTTAQLAGAPVFLLPNPSGRNARYPYQSMLMAFRALCREAGSQ